MSNQEVKSETEALGRRIAYLKSAMGTTLDGRVKKYYQERIEQMEGEREKLARFNQIVEELYG